MVEMDIGNPLKELKTKNKLAQKIVEKGYSDLLKKHNFPVPIENVIKREKQSDLSHQLIGKQRVYHLGDTLNLELKLIYTDWRVGDVFVYMFKVDRSPLLTSKEPPKNPEIIIDRINRAQKRAKKGETFHPTIDPKREFEVIVYNDKWYIVEIAPFQS